MNPGEQLQAETGAMVSILDTIKLDTSTRSGIFGGLRRSVQCGKSLFVNTFTTEQSGEVTVAPSLPGDIEAMELNGETMMVQSGSFRAATMNIDVDSQWGGARSFFSKEGLYLLSCSGRGLMFVSSYGAIHRIDLGPGERYTVDNGHMVAFDDCIRYGVGRSGGWKTTLLSGGGAGMQAGGTRPVLHADSRRRCVPELAGAQAARPGLGNPGPGNTNIGANARTGELRLQGRQSCWPMLAESSSWGPAFMVLQARHQRT